MTLDDEDIRAIAERLAALLHHAKPTVRLVDARELAEILSVDRRWVYCRAEQLGVLRLDGPHGPMRFDVDHVLGLLRQTPEPAARARRSVRRRQRQREVHGLELIDYQS